MELENMPMRRLSKEMRALKREIKRAKLFELQRHVRRIRQLEKKKGSDAQIQKNNRKVERFEQELEFLKDADMEEIARIITEKDGDDGCKHTATERIDQRREQDSSEDIDLKKRALDRIIRSKTLQKFKQKLEATNDDPGGRKQKKAVKQNSKSKSTHGFAADNPKLKDEAEGAAVRRLIEKPKSTRGTLKVETTESGETELQGSSDLESSLGDSELPKFGAQNYVGNYSVGSASLLNESDEGGISASSDWSGSEFQDNSDSMSYRVPKGLESCFVQSMRALKGGQRIKAKNKQGRDKGKIFERKMPKNRKGQRARQQMWEKIYGKNARHLQKKKTEVKLTGNSESMKEGSKAKLQSGPRVKTVDKPLHPSWEAVKRKRSQETLKLEFKGQKIRFDDSE